MTKRKRWPLVLCLLTGLGAAGCTNKEEEQVNSRAKEFAENYFNLRFDKAYGNCTEDSRKWMAFRASNITEHDLEAVRSAPEEAYVSSTECQQINDSTALVRCICRRFVGTAKRPYCSGSRISHPFTERRPPMACQNGRPTAKCKVKSRLKSG